MANRAPSSAKRRSARAKGPTPKGPGLKASAKAKPGTAKPGTPTAGTPTAGSAKPGTAKPGTAKPASAKTPRPGRFTPKAAKTTDDHVPAPTSRYTQPIPRSKRASPPWVPVLLLSLLILGALVIVADYLGVLPYSPTSWYLLVGLVLVAGGFGVATQYR